MVTFAGERTAQPEGEANQAPPQGGMIVPFVRASDEHLESGGVDISRQISVSQQDLGVSDIPAYGYLRWLYIRVVFSGGVGAATAAADAPFNVLQNIALTEPNGAYIAQFTDGYQLYLANKYGGYLPPYAADPKLWPGYTALGTGGNGSFTLRIPVEISGRDGVGSLPNQDSAGQFKLRMQLAPNTTVFTSVPATTQPTVRVTAWMSAWDQPEAASAGMSNQVAPPATGTTQFWSVQSGITVNSGQNTIQLLRKGNYLRNLFFVFKASGARSETGWGTSGDNVIELRRDAFPARYLHPVIWQLKMHEVTGYLGTSLDSGGSLDTGVRMIDFAHEFSGGLGYENRDLWQPTRPSTRLELQGTFAAAGTLDIITNDVAIASNVFL
jgi:hypothetical protein